MNALIAGVDFLWGQESAAPIGIQISFGVGAGSPVDIHTGISNTISGSGINLDELIKSKGKAFSFTHQGQFCFYANGRVITGDITKADIATGEWIQNNYFIWDVSRPGFGWMNGEYQCWRC